MYDILIRNGLVFEGAGTPAAAGNVAIEAGRIAAILVGIVASVARWPWPAELVAFVLFALATIPAWRRYERKA